MSLVISGVIDGPLPGGLPKAIELFATADIADLSIYGLGSPNNGAPGGTIELTLSGSATAGDYIYVASEATDFAAFFGFAPDFTSGVANINGDDALELFENGSVIDVFGVVGVDGTGEPWEYRDGWAYRSDGATAPATTFALADWTFSGPDALDGETANGSATTPFPAGTFANVTPPALSVEINEFRVSEPGTDNNNFVELFTDPGADLTGLTLLAVSGEFEPGQIDLAISLDGATADSDGIVLIAADGNLNLNAGDVAVAGLDFFGSPQTFLVVSDFTGAQGEDLDTNDDGTFDTTPFAETLAAISLTDGDATPDVNYSTDLVAPDGNFTAAGGGAPAGWNRRLRATRLRRPERRHAGGAERRDRGQSNHRDLRHSGCRTYLGAERPGRDHHRHRDRGRQQRLLSAGPGRRRQRRDV